MGRLASAVKGRDERHNTAPHIFTLLLRVTHADSGSVICYPRVVSAQEPPPRTDRLFPIFVREGRSRKRYKAGYINRLGEIVVPPTYDHSYPFWNGLASMRQGEMWGAIDLQGSLVIPTAFGSPLVFTEGISAFSLATPKVEDDAA